MIDTPRATPHPCQPNRLWGSAELKKRKEAAGGEVIGRVACCLESLALLMVDGAEPSSVFSFALCRTWELSFQQHHSIAQPGILTRRKAPGKGRVHQSGRLDAAEHVRRNRKLYNGGLHLVPCLEVVHVSRSGLCRQLACVQPLSAPLFSVL